MAAILPRTSSSTSTISPINRGGDRREEEDEDERTSPEDAHLVAAVERLSISASGAGDKKPLIILDLNGILAHTFFPGESVRVPASRPPDAVVGRKLVFKRPFCEEFLAFCFENLDVAVWSSASRRNVQGAVECVFGEFADRLLFVWDQSQCTDSGFKTPENKHKPLFLKELSKVWEKKKQHGFPRGRSFSSSNTLLVDDSPYKALLNPPNTAIFPDPYRVEDVDDTSLGPGGEMRAFLEGLVAWGGDVPSYVGSRPLGQRPITDLDPHWSSFYSKVVRRFRGPSAPPPASSGSSATREKAKALV